MKPKLTRERLRELLAYDPATGIFTRRKGRGGFHAGTVAGSTSQYYGYVHIAVDDRMYKAHRLAFLYMGEDLSADDEVDHINGDRSDNRWDNLCKSNRKLNSKNCALRSDNTSGVAGVGYHKRRKQWRARIAGIHIGWYSTKEDAIKARQDHPDNESYSERHGTGSSEYNNKFTKPH